MYGSETWTTYARQEHRLNTFHMRCLRRIYNIRWQDHISNIEVLDSAGIPSMYTLLSQRRLRWLGHVCRMSDDRIPKNILYGQLAIGARQHGLPLLRFIDTCKRDLTSCGIDKEQWERLAKDRQAWRAAVRGGSKRKEEKQHHMWRQKRAQRAERTSYVSAPVSSFTCSNCDKECHSIIGLYSHKRHCDSTQNILHDARPIVS